MLLITYWDWRFGLEGRDRRSILVKRARRRRMAHTLTVGSRCRRATLDRERVGGWRATRDP
jgi:hypothetical protein